jgi:hypothetical protein
MLSQASMAATFATFEDLEEEMFVKRFKNQKNKWSVRYKKRIALFSELLTTQPMSQLLLHFKIWKKRQDVCVKNQKSECVSYITALLLLCNSLFKLPTDISSLIIYSNHR